MNEELAAATEPAAPSRGTEPGKAVAPWWHTMLLIGLLLGTSAAGYFSTRRLHASDGHRALNYGLTLGWEWVLACFAYWGLRIRRVALRDVLGVRRSGVSKWMEDAGIALGFWFCSLFVLGAVALLLKPLHIDAESIRRVVTKLAPATGFELTLWFAMSATAGICEEFLFRGYLQQQFSRWTGRVWAGLLCSAVLFGAAHSYEGFAGMLLITVYGALFGALAYARRSLRAGMMAHAWHDGLSGLVLFAAHNFAGRLLH